MIDLLSAEYNIDQNNKKRTYNVYMIIIIIIIKVHTIWCTYCYFYKQLFAL